MKLAMRTQHVVDALLMRLHWIGVPKSQVFYVTGLTKAVCVAVGAACVFMQTPLWGRALIGFFAVVCALALVFISTEEHRIDQRAEERNSLTQRDVPVEDFYLFIHGGMALLWIFWSLLDPTDWAFAGFYTLIWFRSKAHASPRYPKPPAKSHYVLAHGLG